MTADEILERFEKALYADDDTAPLAAVAMPYRHMTGGSNDGLVAVLDKVCEAWRTAREP